jgi:hypothetical protein
VQIVNLFSDYDLGKMELLDEIVQTLLEIQAFTADDISYLCLASNVLS